MENNSRESKRDEFCVRVCGLKVKESAALAKDASTRTYYRIRTEDGKTYIVMDDEGCQNKMAEFVKLSALLNQHGVHAPKVLQKDMAAGFLLLEDLGNDTLTRLLESQEENHLYKLALEPLIQVAKIREKPEFVPELTPEIVLRDICYFTDWYLPMATGKPLSSEQRATFRELVGEVLPLGYRVPKTLVLWDYHVDNVMLPPGETTCAVLDFQDAYWGPLTYDVMSLVEDCRREVDPATTARQIKDLFFASLDGVSRADFDASFAFWSMFRHMRVLGRFTILMACHGKDKYLRFVPHLWEMLNRSLEHPAFAKIKNWLTDNFPAELRGLPRRKPIRKGFIMAAGRGIRMRELTSDRPKPLVRFCGRPIIDYVIERLTQTGITDLVVNACYQKEMLKEYLAARADCRFAVSEEDEALETGGGIKKALPLCGEDPFVVLNSDQVWDEDGFKPLLWRLMDGWNDEKYDIVLLLQDMKTICGDDYHGLGDYKFDVSGRPVRNLNKEAGFPYKFSGISIVHPRVFKNSPDGKFSMVALYDRAQGEGRLGAVVNTGVMYMMSSPEAVAAAENSRLSR